MKSPDELYKKLSQSGSVTIRDTIRIINRYESSYRVEAMGESSSRISTQKIPSVEEIQVYIDAVETVSEWEESGYGDVEGWSYKNIRSSHDWRTGSDNYVRLSTRGDRLLFTTSHTAELFVSSDLLTGPKRSDRTKLAIAIFLNSMSPDMFDYLYDKYQSMYENLLEIRGIGDKVATQLLKERDCTTYKDAKTNLYQTNIPKQYLSTAKKELREKQGKDPNPLIDPEVTQDHSTVIMSNTI